MKFGRICILPLAVVVLALFSSTNNAYATEPAVTSFTLKNVDNSNPVYSDGDTLTIEFDIDTDRGGFPLNVTIGMVNVDNLFDFTDDPGLAYDGEWQSDSTFVITVIDSTGVDFLAGVTFVEPSGTPIRDVLVPADIWMVPSGFLILFVQDNGGGGCDKECQPPTLGLDKNNRRLVENGFSYNGRSVNSELFYTPYPLIKTTTGVYNIAKLKIYEDSGPDKISHVELNFGLAKGETINERRASIIWDKHFDGTEFVSVNSPTNAIDSVKIESTYESCRADSNDQCLVLIIQH